MITLHIVDGWQLDCIHYDPKVTRFLKPGSDDKREARRNESRIGKSCLGWSRVAELPILCLLFHSPLLSWCKEETKFNRIGADVSEMQKRTGFGILCSFFLLFVCFDLPRTTAGMDCFMPAALRSWWNKSIGWWRGVGWWSQVDTTIDIGRFMVKCDLHAAVPYVHSIQLSGGTSVVQ
jgi:hypothetical protein